MGLDSPLMPNELPGYISFLPSSSSSSSSSSSPSLGKGDTQTGKCWINVLEKT